MTEIEKCIRGLKEISFYYMEGLSEDGLSSVNFALSILEQVRDGHLIKPKDDCLTEAYMAGFERGKDSMKAKVKRLEGVLKKLAWSHDKWSQRVAIEALNAEKAEKPIYCKIPNCECGGHAIVGHMPCKDIPPTIEPEKAEKCLGCKGVGKVLGKNDHYGIPNTQCCFCNGTGKVGKPSANCKHEAVYHLVCVHCGKMVDDKYKVKGEIEPSAGLQITCDKCGEQITEQGALLFSPPEDNQCVKIHICKECYKKLAHAIKERMG